MVSRELNELLATDLNSYTKDTKAAYVKVEDIPEHDFDIRDFAGVEIEFGIDYRDFFDEDGNLAEDYVEFAKSVYPVPAFRLGGGGSTSANMMNSIGPYPKVTDANGTEHPALERKPSYYVSLPPGSSGTVGSKSQDVLKTGIVELLKIIYANNPNAEVMPCISILTMTPQETADLIHFLTDTKETYWGKVRADMGIEAPVNIKYIELTNECDRAASGYEEAHRNWYTATALQHIEAIESVDSSIKIMACGPTAPWSWHADQGKAWIKNIAQKLGSRIDAVSFHPYYNGGTAEAMMMHARQYKNWIDEEIGENDILISFTEHAVNYNYANYPNRTSDYGAAVDSMYFITKAAASPIVDGAFYNGFFSLSPLWQYWTKKDGQYYCGATQKMLELYYDNICEANMSVLKTTVTENDFSEKLGALSVKLPDDKICIILANRMPYTDIDITFDLDGEYTLVKKETLSAPNMLTWGLDKKCSDLITRRCDTTQKENFTTFKMSEAEIVVLTLQKK